ncbi:hypothetical protein M3223_04270 [Paenibacillus pasadenensis]|uniref:gp33 family protein n=1 Tax=Paenibacillus pasadenensis TaxID=217090 RepID=UPI0020414668|nr:hypothetical protein [Paenibacillus pasadenensis]MCM3746565.1 hypothetical protein [Paenibacillus pasadenensis]
MTTNMQNAVTGYAEQLVKVREEIETAESVLKGLGEKKAEIEQGMFAMMVEEGIDGIKHGGFSFSPSVRPFASLSAETKEEAFDWLRENGYGDLIKEAVNANSLTSLYKELGADEAPEEFLALLNVHNKQQINVRKSGR